MKHWFPVGWEYVAALTSHISKYYLTVFRQIGPEQMGTRTNGAPDKWALDKCLLGPIHLSKPAFLKWVPCRTGAPQGLARCATLAFRKFTTCFLHYSLFSGIYKIGYDDHLEVIKYPTLQLLQPYSWHKTLFLACCSA